MDIMVLGTDFLPDTLIEGWESLIWTDRYREAGEFELKTANIQQTMTLMPIGEMVTLRSSEAGSSDVMFIEDHIIDKKEDENGDKKLTVRGRSFETFFENRVARGRGTEALYVTTSENSQDWKPFLGEGGQASGTIAGYIIGTTSINEPYYNITDLLYGQEIPNFTITVQSTAQLPTIPRRLVTIQPGNIYERVLELLAMDDLGIRAATPTDGSGVLNLIIYGGTDKSASVVLSTGAGHFISSSYLWSNKDYKNMAFAFSYYDWLAVDGESNTGLNRRIGFLDASDIKGTNINQDDAALTQRSQTYLKEHKKLAVFDGEVAQDIPFQYWTDYFLGDIIRVIGEYGVNQNMRVTEYVRIEDSEGYRAYPGLSQL